MRIDPWIHDLPARLELAADSVDDVAQSDWVTSDGHRERLFSVEAQLWRIARTTERGAAQPEDLVPFLERSLRAVRSNVRLCLRIPVCDDDVIELLQGVARELDEAVAELEVLAGLAEPPLRLAAGGRP